MKKNIDYSEIPDFDMGSDLDPEVETFWVIIDHPKPEKRRKICIQAPNPYEVDSILEKATPPKIASQGNVAPKPSLARTLIEFLKVCATNPKFDDEQAKKLIKNRPTMRLQSLLEKMKDCLGGLDDDDFSESSIEADVENL